MEFVDERYVRLYVRDTATWKSWAWTTRAVFVLLLRKVDRAGVLDTGRLDKAQALALVTEVPLEVAKSALEQLLGDGTVEERERSLVIPRFLEAQECRQSDKQRQAESRARRATARNLDTACHTVSPAVTSGHNLSQPVTPYRTVPCCAVPCSAEETQREESAGTNVTANHEIQAEEKCEAALRSDGAGAPSPRAPDEKPQKELLPREPQQAKVPAREAAQGAPEGGGKPKRVRKPEVRDLSDELTDDEYDVWEHWRRVMNHPKAVCTPDRRKLIQRWLPVYGVERLQAAISGCAKSRWHMGDNDRGKRYDALELILRDARHIEDFEALYRRCSKPRLEAVK